MTTTPAFAFSRTLPCVIVLLAAVFATACKSRSSLPRTMPVTKEMRAEAQRATELGKWSTAAQRWYSIFVGSGSKDREACAQSARAMMHLNDPESALRVLEAGLATDVESAELWELKGDALVMQSFRRAAESSYEKAVNLDGKRASAWRALGRVRVDLGYERAAVEPLQKAIDLGRDDFATHVLLARAKNDSGDPCGAFQAYMRAFQRGEGEPKQYVEAAMLHMNEVVRRVHKEAAQCAQAWLEKAIERNPQYERAVFELGVLHEEQGRQDQAIECYRRAVAIEPSFLPAMRNLALLYFERRDQKATREWVKLALAHERDPERRKALESLLEPLTRDGEALPEPPREPKSLE